MRDRSAEERHAKRGNDRPGWQRGRKHLRRPPEHRRDGWDRGREGMEVMPDDNEHHFRHPNRRKHRGH